MALSVTCLLDSQPGILVNGRLADFGLPEFTGHERVFCELNSRPPNPGSDGFHLALGFAEIGTATVYDAPERFDIFSVR
jgi:predicted GNAT superfamily acetyltransferase